MDKCLKCFVCQSSDIENFEMEKLYKWQIYCFYGKHVSMIVKVNEYRTNCAIQMFTESEQKYVSQKRTH